MDFLQALLLGVVEGITEFLPASSTGHLALTEKLLGLSIDDPGVTAFTAIIQVGAILAVIVYFRSDIIRLAVAWGRGLAQPDARRDPDYRFAWYVIVGSIPIGIAGFLGKDLISGGLRNLWVVFIGLAGWSIVMALAERIGKQQREEKSVTLADAVFIGVMQCVALIPGVSRSGATISAGLFRGLNRVAATRLSFFLSIPALTAAGAYEGVTQAGALSASVGWVPTIVASVVSFVYASIAWLLHLVAKHSPTVFIGYRAGLKILIAILLATGVVSAT